MMTGESGVNARTAANALPAEGRSRLAKVLIPQKRLENLKQVNGMGKN
jgi:hypothetical protein